MMKVVCAWCGRHIGGHGKVTHTCCPACEETYFKGGRDAQGVRQDRVCQIGENGQRAAFQAAAAVEQWRSGKGISL